MKVERTHLIGFTLALAKLWVLPYKGLEVAMSIHLDQSHPHLFLALGMLPSLMLVVELLLSCEEFKCLNMALLPFELIGFPLTVAQPNDVSIYAVVS
jgi:hypothetical protein